MWLTHNSGLCGKWQQSCPYWEKWILFEDWEHIRLPDFHMFWFSKLGLCDQHLNGRMSDYRLKVYSWKELCWKSAVKNGGSWMRHLKIRLSSLIVWLTDDAFHVHKLAVVSQGWQATFYFLFSNFSQDIWLQRNIRNIKVPAGVVYLFIFFTKLTQFRGWALLYIGLPRVHLSCIQ